MARNRFQPSTLTVTSAVTAAIAAIALTACGPNDSAESSAFSGGAAPAATTAAQSPTQIVAADRAGTPVPPAVVAQPAPAYVPLPPVQVAAAPQYAQPGYAPQPAYPAQSTQPYAANTGYATQPVRVADRPVAEPRPVDRNHAGSVESIVPVRERPQGTGTGAVIGGVLGAVVGNQFGHGSGRAVMTGAGAVGGALAGNHIERARNEQVTGYRASIRLDNGGVRTFERNQVGGLQVGDRVRVDAASFRRV